MREKNIVILLILNELNYLFTFIKVYGEENVQLRFLVLLMLIWKLNLLYEIILSFEFYNSTNK